MHINIEPAFKKMIFLLFSHEILLHANFKIKYEKWVKTIHLYLHISIVHIITDLWNNSRNNQREILLYCLSLKGGILVASYVLVVTRIMDNLSDWKWLRSMIPSMSHNICSYGRYTLDQVLNANLCANTSDLHSLMTVFYVRIIIIPLM